MSGSTEIRGRRAFGPTLLMGVPAAAVAVLAASKPMLASPDLTGDRYEALGSVPLVVPATVVALLCWGLVLLLPGQWRRGAAAIGLFAALGAIAAADMGLEDAEEDLAEAVLSLGGNSVQIEWTSWFWVLLVSSLLCALAFGVALRHAHLWPGMSRRYDAPGARPDPEEPVSNQDLWRAMDEGRDPTAPPARDDN